MRQPRSSVVGGRVRTARREGAHMHSRVPAGLPVLPHFTFDDSTPRVETTKVECAVDDSDLMFISHRFLTRSPWNPVASLLYLMSSRRRGSQSWNTSRRTTSFGGEREIVPERGSCNTRLRVLIDCIRCSCASVRSHVLPLVARLSYINERSRKRRGVAAAASLIGTSAFNQYCPDVSMLSPEDRQALPRDRRPFTVRRV